MKFVIPEKLGIYRKKLILEVFDLLFHDSANQTGYSYTNEIYDMCYSLGLNSGASPEHKFIRCLVEVNKVYQMIFGEKAGLGDSYAAFSGYMNSFHNKYSSTSNRTVKNWIDEEGDKRINSSFDPAFLFSYMILNSDCVFENKFAEFYKKCLELLGITDVEKIVWQRMLNFDWKETRRVQYGEYTINKITDKSIVFFIITLSTVMALLGQSNIEESIGKYHQFFKELFADEINISNTVEFSQQMLFNCTKMFEPRSIYRADTFYPEEYYIPAEFECKSPHGAATPIEGLACSETGLRNLICAKTGFGKSVYMQMLTICMLASSLGEDSFQKPEDKARLEAIKKMGKTLGAPEGMFVISIPARMFSECFKRKTEGIENDDFVELFFDSIWHFSSKYNFYSPQNLHPVSTADNVDTQHWRVNSTVKDYIHGVAKKGKLVLLLDSFDEITQGEMRTRYLKAISKFYDEYCNYPESKSVGAHIVMTTRQMSVETMTHIEERLGVNSDAQRFTIKPLSDKAKLELIKRWHNEDEISPEELLVKFKENHFYDEYSQNPYMLSVVCSQFGANLTRITTELMETLIRRMQANNSGEKSYEVQDVLNNIRDILRTVAIDTLLENKHTFNESYLSTVIKEYLDVTDMEPDEIVKNLKKIYSIFVTEVGLIVPADGEDRAYQFINNQIRYQLATDGFRGYLSKEERADVMKRLLSRKVSMNEYTGLLVPLLCAEGTENVGAAEELIRGLTLHDYDNEQEAFYLIRAMMDLVLGRYGTSIATVNLSNDVDREDILKCQRMLVIRMLSSAFFAPTEKEKAAILSSNAYNNSSSWICQALKNLLTE